MRLITGFARFRVDLMCFVSALNMLKRFGSDLMSLPTALKRFGSDLMRFGTDLMRLPTALKRLETDLMRFGTDLIIIFARTIFWSIFETNNTP